MHVLFVCTGNICRSPLAEGIARHRYHHLASFSSAGIATYAGAPPSALATQAGAEIGVDIAALRGTTIGSALEPPPDRIYVMTDHHRSRLIAAYPRLAGRIELLDPGGDIPDPYGFDLPVYRAVRDQIGAAIEQRAGEWISATRNG